MPCYFVVMLLGLPLAIVYEIFFMRDYEGPNNESRTAGFFGMSFMFGVVTLVVFLAIIFCVMAYKLMVKHG